VEDPDRRPAREGRPADDHAQHPAAGGHHQGQRAGAGQCGRVLQDRRPEERDRAGRELHGRDELLSEREKINEILQGIIDEATGPWGIKVTIVEVKDVEIPSGMQRAMARQAEAERERRAKIINAEGEFQAAEKLKDAALVIEEHPIALQLRYLQTMLEVSGGGSSTIIFPAPVDIIRPFLERAEK
jgi:regulator of protease activity HflC (stomatin/prohibitin superfamily)